MKKMISFILIIMLVSIAACRTAVKETTQVDVSGSDAAVDAVGNDLNNVNDVEEELNTDDLNDVESGLNDVENI